MLRSALKLRSLYVAYVAQTNQMFVGLHCTLMRICLGLPVVKNLKLDICRWFEVPALGHQATSQWQIAEKWHPGQTAKLKAGASVEPWGF
jgi:hypothetical protein